MRKLRALIGMPVVVHDRKIGRVVQAELTEDLNELRGLWVDTGLRGTRLIPAESLQLLGRVAVVADDAGQRSHSRSNPLFRRAVGTDGRRIGAITGAEIDELSFRVEALELSGGFWDDLLYGRTRVQHFTLNRENGDVLIDVAETEREGIDHEEWNDEGPDHRRTDRRLDGDGVRHHELAVGAPDEPAGQEDRPLDHVQDR